MEVRHLNHSCLLVTMAGTRILVDPGGFSVEKIKEFGPLTGLDAVLITHQHPDHIHPGLLDLARLVEEQPPGLYL